MNRRDRGQILPLFALMLVAILGMTALAIDVSNAYAARQFYRTAADAAALAGGQDLQGTTRAVTGADQIAARTDALLSLAKQLEPPDQPYIDPLSADPSCDPTNNIASCPIPNSPYQVRITTPVAPGGCVSCDPTHSIAVSVGNPTFQLSFAHVMGFDHWNVSNTSVAGLQFSASYALVTLRPNAPPRHDGTDPNLKDIDLTGGSGSGFSTATTVNIINGDIGTNTYLSTESDTHVNLLDGYPSAGGQPTPNYRIYHFDQVGLCANPTTPCDTWNKDITNSYPVGWKINQLINDPQYVPNPLPRPSGTLTQNPSDPNTGLVGISCNGIGCSPAFACPDAPTNYLPNGTECYKSGVYPSVFGLQGSGPGVYLQPGVYFFDQGIQINSGQSLWGGLQSNLPGVSIVVPQSPTGGNKGFSTNTADVVALNGGDPSCVLSTCRAAPARDINNNPVATPQGLPITIYVPRDESCFTGAVPILCNPSPDNKAVTIGGNSKVVIGGVVYGPSDNMNIASNETDQNGVVGQIISWTVDYTGHATLNQEGPPQTQGGTLRLDAACTAPGTPCIP